MKNFKDCKPFTRFVMPVVAIIGAVFFIICGTGIYQLITTGKLDSLLAFGVFMVFFALLMFPSLFFYKEKKENTDE